MKVELISITDNCEQVIEEAGRTCYKSKVGNPSIIKNWIKAGHCSVVEHASATFRISEVSRALTHQLVRHRIAGYSQESQRYVKQDQFEYVIPDSIINSDMKDEYIHLMMTIQDFYTRAINIGIKKEDVRYILPNACHTEIVTTMNFRSWRNFLILRMDKHAQWEIRKMANEIFKILYEHAPNVFGDLKEGEK